MALSNATVFGGSGGGGTVTSVTAADGSVVVAGTAANPTVRTGTVDAIATAHPAAADWSNASHKITNVANGSAAQDAAAFGQIPTNLPPNGAAGGDLTGTYPSPTVGAGKITTAKLSTAVTLDAIAAANATAADWSNASHKITNVANGSAAQDAAAFGQIPTNLPPNGAAGGDLNGNFPNPGVPKINGVTISNTPTVGQVLTATDATHASWAGGFITITKAADESRTSNIVLTNDADFLFATVAGKWYLIQGLFIYGSPAGGGTPDFKVGCGEDATARGSIGCYGPGVSDTPGAQTCLDNQSSTFSLGTATNDRVAAFSGSHLGNGATWHLLWAQVSSSANPTILRAGSFLQYRQVN